METIKEYPKHTLESILKIDLTHAFVWRESPQTGNFWDKAYYGVVPVYTDKGLWYKCKKGDGGNRFITNKLYKCQNDLLETAKAFIDETGVPSGFFTTNSNNFILATPEEVYTHLKQKDMEKQKSKEPTNLDWKSYGVQMENLKLKETITEITSQNEKLNKLVDEIEANCEDQTNPRMKLNAIHRLIYLHRDPSLLGTTQTVEIAGKKYEVTINKEI